MVAIPEFTNTTPARIFAAREAEQENWDSYGTPVSQANDPCPRKIWYGLRWLLLPETFKGRILRIFETGQIHETQMIEDLRRIGCEVRETDPVTGKQFAVALARGFLRGRIDALVTGLPEAPKTEHVVEIKSAKNTDFSAIVKHGVAKKKPEHYGQIILYMLDTGLTRGAYIVVCKNTDQIHIERLRLEDVLDDAERIVAQVESLIDAESPPPKLHDDGDKFPCSFCRFKGHCQEGDMPERRACRTCLHFRFTRDGNGECVRWGDPKTPSSQKEGCPAHLFLPGLIPGEQIDADPETETVTYRMADGSEWVDGNKEIAP